MITVLRPIRERWSSRAIAVALMLMLAVAASVARADARDRETRFPFSVRMLRRPNATNPGK